MNYSKQTQLQFKGRLDPGYLVLRVSPEIAFRPRELLLPAGVEVAVSGQWHGLARLRGEYREVVPISEMAPCVPPSIFELHLRNLTGHPIEGSVFVNGLSPRDPRIGRRKIIGWLNVYQEADTA